MSLLEHTNNVLNRVRQESDSVLLFYSGGKDSIVLLDLLSKAFTKVHAVQMYFVPGLEHIEKFLNWSRLKYKNVEFISTPHWQLSYILQCGIYCSPNPEIKQISLAMVDKAMREKTGCLHSFYGMKQADSMNRRLMLKTFELEAISATNKIYPLTKWKDADIKAYIKFHKLIQPISYGENKRSHGVIFDETVFLYLEKHYPGDLEKIFNHFPLSQSILFNYYQHVKA